MAVFDPLVFDPGVFDAGQIDGTGLVPVEILASVVSDQIFNSVFDPEVFDPEIFDTQALGKIPVESSGVLGGTLIDLPCVLPIEVLAQLSAGGPVSVVFHGFEQGGQPIPFDFLDGTTPIQESAIPIQVEFVGGKAYLTWFREAIKGRLRNDPFIVALVGVNIRYRPARIPEEYPSVTFFDFGNRPDANVPFLDRTVQIDIWGNSLEVSELIAQRIESLMDYAEARRTGNIPWQAVNGVRIAQSILGADRNEALDDGDTTRKTLEFRVLAYKI